MIRLNVSHQRLFTTQARQLARQVYAKLCENGQGSNFRFRLRDKTRIVNVNYSTFWNNFSHYQLAEETSKGPESVDIAKEDMLFADKDKFVELLSSKVAFLEKRSNKFTTEDFTHSSLNDGTFSAFIP